MSCQTFGGLHLASPSIFSYSGRLALQLGIYSVSPRYCLPFSSPVCPHIPHFLRYCLPPSPVPSFAHMAWSLARSRTSCNNLTPRTTVWSLPDGDCWFYPCPNTGSAASKTLSIRDNSSSPGSRRESQLERARIHNVSVDLDQLWLPSSVRCVILLQLAAFADAQPDQIHHSKRFSTLRNRSHCSMHCGSYFRTDPVQSKHRLLNADFQDNGGSHTSDHESKSFGLSRRLAESFDADVQTRIMDARGPSLLPPLPPVPADHQL